MHTNTHEPFMRRAIELARNAPQFPFGSVIVDPSSGVVVAEGWNRAALNPTWHGELDAINHLAARQIRVDPQQLVLYTTAEPCAMCQSAILWSGIGTVVYGASIRFLQKQGWQQIDIPAEEVVQRSSFAKCKIIGGILEPDCEKLFFAAKSNPTH